jgi:hypothetical protein
MIAQARCMLLKKSSMPLSILLVHVLHRRDYDLPFQYIIVVENTVFFSPQIYKGILMIVPASSKTAVLMRQLRGLGHQPPDGDQTHFGYG